MARRLSAADKIKRAIEGSSRPTSVRALLATIEELIAAEIRDIYADENQDEQTQAALLSRATSLYKINPAVIEALTSDAYDARRERMASRADPEAIATIHAKADLSEALAQALRSIGGA